jgi:hypothetical protein
MELEELRCTVHEPFPLTGVNGTPDRQTKRFLVFGFSVFQNFEISVPEINRARARHHAV